MHCVLFAVFPSSIGRLFPWRKSRAVRFIVAGRVGRMDELIERRENASVSNMLRAYAELS